jgi:hypothetical protein
MADLTAENTKNREEGKEILWGTDYLTAKNAKSAEKKKPL